MYQRLRPIDTAPVLPCNPLLQCVIIRQKVSQIHAHFVDGRERIAQYSGAGIREILASVRGPKVHRNRTCNERLEQLFSNVIDINGILKGDRKPVFLHQRRFVAAIHGISLWSRQRPPAALAKDVDWDKVLKLLHEVEASRRAVGDNPKRSSTLEDGMEGGVQEVGGRGRSVGQPEVYRGLLQREGRGQRAVVRSNDVESQQERRRASVRQVSGGLEAQEHYDLPAASGRHCAARLQTIHYDDLGEEGIKCSEPNAGGRERACESCSSVEVLHRR